MVVVGDCKDQ